jgi:hypothetical protein
MLSKHLVSISIQQTVTCIMNNSGSICEPAWNIHADFVASTLYPLYSKGGKSLIICEIICNV